MKTELIRFSTQDGLQLHGLLFTPEEKTNKVIIHVHGSAGNFYENDFIDNFAKSFTGKGYAFFVFNNRGCEYIKEIVKKENGVSTCPIIGMLNEVFEDCVFDIQGAFNFCKERGFREFVLQGHSLGCNKVVYYALKANFKGKLVLLAPCDLARNEDETYIENITLAKKLVKNNKGLEKIPNFWGKFDISALTLLSIWSNDVNADMFRYRDGKVVEALKALDNNILVQIGTADTCFKKVDESISEYIRKGLPNSKLQINLIEDVIHHYKGKVDEVATNITNWLYQSIK